MKKVSLLTVGLVTLFLICCCGGTGLLCSQGLGGLLDKRADEVSGLPTTPDVATGKKAVLTGILTGNAPITSDPDVPDIAQYEVVAYQVQVYERRTTGSGSSRRTSNSWNTTRTVVGTLKLDVQDETITFTRDTSLGFNGSMHVFPDGGSFSEGDHRVRGFQNGDLLTIVARRGENGQFTADELYGGTRDQLIANTRTLARVFRYGGYALLIFAGFFTVVMAIIGGFILTRGRSR